MVSIARESLRKRNILKKILLPPLIGGFFCTLLLSCATAFNSSQSYDPNSGWPKEYLAFFEGLTSPMNEWNERDLGESPKYKDLLKKHLPRIYLPIGAPIPLDYYRDYLPTCQLRYRNSKTRRFKGKLDRRLLKTIERHADKNLECTYQFKRYSLSYNETIPIYSQSFEDTLVNHSSGESRDIIVLKYNLVFPTSGLPAKMSWYKSLGTWLLGNQEVWHDLDIHGAIHLLLDKKNQKILSVVLAQHNHFQSFVNNVDLELKTGGDLQVCFSVRSNEPYLCPKKEKLHPTVGKLENFHRTLAGSLPIFDGGYDRVLPIQANQKPLNLRNEFLLTKDPLRVSWLSLGTNRSILGFPSLARMAPPGMVFNTWPQLKSYGDLAQFWYTRGEARKLAEMFKKHVRSFIDVDIDPILKFNGDRFHRKLDSIH